ncbi:MAG: helix-hairpin-helix domain-containing protein [Gammaproteobacteria bacterium]|nr:helix-hairpin-helix domain-containing protein [Gammaproteobacteria bacterium]
MKSVKLSAVLATFLFSAGLQAAPVNINVASADNIAESLSGIGLKKAQAVVDYRNQHGLYKSAVDIVQVKGIGPSIFEKNKSDILIK